MRALELGKAVKMQVFTGKKSRYFGFRRGSGYRKRKTGEESKYSTDFAGH